MSRPQYERCKELCHFLLITHWHSSILRSRTDPEGKKSITLKSNVDFDETVSKYDMNNEELVHLIKIFRKLNKKGRRFNEKRQYKQNR